MKIPGANTIIQYKGRRFHDHYRRWDQPAKDMWSYIYLKSRKKIKRKRKVDYLYEVEILEWNDFEDKYVHTEDTKITIHTIRSMFANKHPGEMKFVKDTWEAIVAKTFLIG